MKKIGILYICTGPYVLFWEDFFRSFEEKFLSDFEKQYFVFTDSDDIYASDNNRVHKYALQAQPWPLITLLRFNTFLSIEDELNKCDYLLFSNANIICVEKIVADDLLPRESLAEDLFVTTHPGYCGKKKIDFPYERHCDSLAYIPWNKGNAYVIGAFFGGTSRAFITLCKVLRMNIEEDLKKNIIAKWHDESHLNRYIIGKTSVRVLSPEYCYPFGMNVTYKRKIAAVSKQDKFDVKAFKGAYSKPDLNILKRFTNVIDSIVHDLAIWGFYIKDIILNKNLDLI